jgi:NADPH:quinone reductase-like Zn-dependent oxidoreductase
MPTYQKLVATSLTPDFREAAELREAEVPDPGPGELLVRNRWAGVNATDVNITAGRYAADPALPFDLGAEAVGVVEAVGEGVEGWAENQPVATMGLGGGYRELQTVPAKYAVPVPEASPEVLSILVSGLTASIALDVVGEVTDGETVLVTAAAGGTGQYAVQLAKRAGATVVGTCGSDEKAALLRDLGADRAVNYRDEDLGAVLKDAGPYDVVYESVGRRFFDLALRNLALKGRLVVIGYVSEYVDGLEETTGPRVYASLLQKSASIRGFFLPHFAEHYAAHVRALVGLVQGGELQVAIDERQFEGVGQIVEAVEYLHSGQSRGKVVVQLS